MFALSTLIASGCEGMYINFDIPSDSTIKYVSSKCILKVVNKWTIDVVF